MLDYELLLLEAGQIGYLGTKDLKEIRNRHIIESLLPAFFWNKEFSNVKDVADLGSGAGLPGIPLAIAMPKIQFFLVEVMKKRAEFLEKCCSYLKLGNITVCHTSVEDLDIKVDLATFRAFRKPLAAFELSLFALKPEGQILYFRNKPMFLKNNFHFARDRLNELGFTYHTRSQNHPILNHDVGFVIGKQVSSAKLGFPRKYYKIKKDPLFREIENG